MNAWTALGLRSLADHQKCSLLDTINKEFITTELLPTNSNKLVSEIVSNSSNHGGPIGINKYNFLTMIFIMQEFVEKTNNFRIVQNLIENVSHHVIGQPFPNLYLLVQDLVARLDASAKKDLLESEIAKKHACLLIIVRQRLILIKLS